MPTDTTDDVPEVELIETSRFDLPEAATNEPVARAPIVSGRTLAVLAVAVIVVGLIVIPRTIPESSLDQGSQTTASTAPPPTTSIPGEATGAVSGERSTTVVTQAIPLFSDGITPDIPGVISGIDADGSLIVIDRTQLKPQETKLGMAIAEGAPRSTLILAGGAKAELDRDLSFEGARIVVNHGDGRFLEPSFALAEVSPGGEGRAVLVSHELDSQVVVVIPLGWDGIDTSSLLEWELPGQGVEVLGVWGDQLVVHRANKIWLLATTLEATPIGDGQLLAYDGAHLAQLVCEAPDQCSLAVGPPDDPGATTIALPPTLADADPDDWTGSISISPDGTRLVASVRFGALSLPVVVDLVTGETASLADGMNRQAPVAWSPDGQWVGYVYTNDVMVWNLEEQRSWRIQVNRDLETLLWR